MQMDNVDLEHIRVHICNSKLLQKKKNVPLNLIWSSFLNFTFYTCRTAEVFLHKDHVWVVQVNVKDPAS